MVRNGSPASRPEGWGEAQKGRLARGLPPPGETVRGTLVTTRLRCGKASCRCRERGHEGHGPYTYLHLTLGPGRTKTLYLAGDQIPRVRRWTRNFRRFRAILERITLLNVTLLERERRASPRPRRGRGG